MASLLMAHGLSEAEAQALLKVWLIQGDFLLESMSTGFSHIIGNPPYVRQELIPTALLAEYRRRFVTLFDRADLYIPFIEKSLEHLEPEGALGFICSDRWMKNRYGGPLRELVSKRFNLKYYVDMVDTPAFHTDVTAYPAITVITRETPTATCLAHRPPISRFELAKLAREMRGPAEGLNHDIKEVLGIVHGREPWILESFDQLSIVRRLEAAFPALEEARCKVGIGVATGADKVFVGPFDDLDVEADRKLPLVMTKDIRSGRVKWHGQGVINPFGADGRLVDLKDYPRLTDYLHRHEAVIRKRHVAKRNSGSWYRTIDRIYPKLTTVPKLLIPDIKGEPAIVYEEGHFYPHHNLHYITSDEWDLRGLQAVLLSGIARLFISIYSTRMRGGYLRYQAQYLRRIRVPFWRDVPGDVRAELIRAAEQADIAACNEAVFDLYGLSTQARSAIGNGNNN
ncbi:MAG: Eco57I restriction-modification methylase domain-containing protein [Thermodesulfobacteriota bacterium]|nr:Eco57I restriction-modification methylase domain-containing protein [Thermodesulfobacteriota bacterium]